MVRIALLEDRSDGKILYYRGREIPIVNVGTVGHVDHSPHPLFREVSMRSTSSLGLMSALALSLAAAQPIAPGPAHRFDAWTEPTTRGASKHRTKSETPCRDQARKKARKSKRAARRKNRK